MKMATTTKQRHSSIIWIKSLHYTTALYLHFYSAKTKHQWWCKDYQVHTAAAEHNINPRHPAAPLLQY